MEEAEIMQQLRVGVERNLITPASASTAAAALAPVYKQYRQSSNRVNSLCEDTYLLEKQLQETATDAEGAEQQLTKDRESHAASSAQLQQDICSAETELYACEETAKAVEAEVKALQHQIAELQAGKSGGSDEVPTLEALREDAGTILTSIQRESTTKGALTLELQGLRGDLEQTQRTLHILLASRKAEAKEAISTDSSALQRVALLDKLKAEIMVLQGQKAAISTGLSEQHVALHKLQRACQQPQIEVQQAQQALNRGRKRLQKTIKAQDALRTHLEIMNGSAENLLAERVGVELKHEQWQQDETAEVNLHKMLVTKCNKLLSAVTLAEDGTGKLQEENSGIESACALIAKVLLWQSHQASELIVRIDEAAAALEACKRESAPKEAEARGAAELLKQRRAAVLVLEGLLASEAAALAGQARRQASLSRARNQEASALHHTRREIEATYKKVAEQAKHSQALRRTAKEPLARSGSIKQMHDILQVQLNQFVAVLQAAKQALHSLKMKAAAERQEQIMTEKQCKETQAEINRAIGAKSNVQRQSLALHQQVASIERSKAEAEAASELLALEVTTSQRCMKVSASEKLLLASSIERICGERQRLQHAVSLCSADVARLKQIQAVYDSSLQRGTLALLRLEDETRLWALKQTELSHLIQSWAKAPPRYNADRDIASLQACILREVIKGEEISKMLEATSNCSRLRRLDGPTHDMHELHMRVGYLTHNIEQKRQQMEYCELVLSELDHLALHLTHEAAVNMPKGLALYKEMNKATKLRFSVSRQTIAVLSEGALFQDMQEHLAGDFGELKDQARIVRETGGVQQGEVLAVDPISTVLTIC